MSLHICLGPISDTSNGLWSTTRCLDGAGKAKDVQMRADSEKHTHRFCRGSPKVAVFLLLAVRGVTVGGTPVTLRTETH